MREYGCVTLFVLIDLLDLALCFMNFPLVIIQYIIIAGSHTISSGRAQSEPSSCK